MHQRSPLRLIFNDFCHSGLKTCFSWMRTQLNEQDRYFRSLLRWNMRHWGDQSTMMLKKTMTLRLEMKVQRASCKVLENAFAETETEKGRFRWIFFVELSFINYTWQDTTDTVSSVIEKYLKAPLEEFKCLRCFDNLNTWEKYIFVKIKTYFFKFQYFRFWKHFEETSKANEKIVKALLKVVRQHLTPPPSSTNVERLFSYGGLVATDHRSTLSGEKLDQILFLRENALMANFDLGWL